MLLVLLLHLSDCRPVMFCGCCCWRQAPAGCRLALGIFAADAWRWRWLWPVRGRRLRRMPTSSSPASTTPAFACASLRERSSEIEIYNKSDSRILVPEVEVCTRTLTVTVKPTVNGAIFLKFFL